MRMYGDSKLLGATVDGRNRAKHLGCIKPCK